MLVIGLAGGSGSGKAIVSSLFSLNGIPSFDCDAVYHELLRPNRPLSRELAQEFGPSVLLPDGGIDRHALADIVFSDEEKRETLNKISHKRVLSVCREWIGRAEKQGIKAVLIDAPLLYESGFDRECDLTVAVTAPTDLRVQRIVQRDRITPDKARERIAAQIPDEELSKRADYVIRNDGDIANAVVQCNTILRKINERRLQK